MQRLTVGLEVLYAHAMYGRQERLSKGSRIQVDLVVREKRDKMVPTLSRPVEMIMSAIVALLGASPRETFVNRHATAGR